MIRLHDSGYDSRKCNMHVVISFVYAITGNAHMLRCLLDVLWYTTNELNLGI